jgi:hypothetical protein
MAEKQIARNDELTASFKTISVNNPIRRVSDASQSAAVLGCGGDQRAARHQDQL